MKKFMYIFGILALMSAGVACNNDLTDEDDPLPPDAIRPALYGGGEVNNELTAFFEKNLSIIGHSIFDDYHEHWGRVRNEVDSCVMINSAEEFRQIDFINSPLELPAIDFDAYTLVIGQYVAAHGGITLVSQGIVIDPEMTTMNLITGSDENMDYTQAIEVNAFWGLYPKFSSESIRTNVVFIKK